MKAIPHLQLFLALIFASILIFILDQLRFLSLPKSTVYFITNPISFGIYRIGQTFENQFHFIFTARFSAKENKALQEQLGKLLSENATLRRNLAEAESMLSQEKKLDPVTFNLFPARPIGLDRYLKIDKGGSDGVKVGQAVVFEDNYIGKVVNVSEKGAKVMLVTDPDSKISAFSISKDGKAKGILQGVFGSEMLMDKILHEEIVAQKDLVYSEGLEGFLPRGLILGQVTQVMDTEHEVFKQAKVSPLFDIRDLELVFIIKE